MFGRFFGVNNLPFPVEDTLFSDPLDNYSDLMENEDSTNILQYPYSKNKQHSSDTSSLNIQNFSNMKPVESSMNPTTIAAAATQEDDNLIEVVNPLLRHSFNTSNVDQVFNIFSPLPEDEITTSAADSDFGSSVISIPDVLENPIFVVQNDNNLELAPLSVLSSDFAIEGSNDNFTLPCAPVDNQCLYSFEESSNFLPEIPQDNSLITLNKNVNKNFNSSIQQQRLTTVPEHDDNFVVVNSIPSNIQNSTSMADTSIDIDLPLSSILPNVQSSTSLTQDSNNDGQLSFNSLLADTGSSIAATKCSKTIDLSLSSLLSDTESAVPQSGYNYQSSANSIPIVPQNSDTPVVPENFTNYNLLKNGNTTIPNKSNLIEFVSVGNTGIGTIPKSSVTQPIKRVKIDHVPYPSVDSNNTNSLQFNSLKNIIIPQENASIYHTETIQSMDVDLESDIEEELTHNKSIAQRNSSQTSALHNENKILVHCTRLSNLTKPVMKTYSGPKKLALMTPKNIDGTYVIKNSESKSKKGIGETSLSFSNVSMVRIIEHSTTAIVVDRSTQTDIVFSKERGTLVDESNDLYQSVNILRLIRMKNNRNANEMDDETSVSNISTAKISDIETDSEGLLRRPEDLVRNKSHTFTKSISTSCDEPMEVNTCATNDDSDARESHASVQNNLENIPEATSVSDTPETSNNITTSNISLESHKRTTSNTNDQIILSNSPGISNKSTVSDIPESSNTVISDVSHERNQMDVSDENNEIVVSAVSSEINKEKDKRKHTNVSDNDEIVASDASQINKNRRNEINMSDNSNESAVSNGSSEIYKDKSSEIYISDALNNISLGSSKYQQLSEKAKKFLKDCIVDLFRNWCKIDVHDFTGNTPLHRAVIAGNTQLVRRLCIVHKCRKVSVDIKNLENQTALHLATKKGDYKMLKILLEFGASQFEYDNDGNTPLHLAVLNGFPSCVRVLTSLDQKAVPVNSFNCEGFNPLHLTAIQGSFECFQALLKRHPVIDLKDSRSGRTALFHAIENKNRSIVLQLVKLGASSTSQNYCGHTPMLAANELSVDDKKVISEIISNENSKKLKLKLEEGNTDSDSQDASEIEKRFKKMATHIMKEHNIKTRKERKGEVMVIDRQEDDVDADVDVDMDVDSDAEKMSDRTNDSDAEQCRKSIVKMAKKVMDDYCLKLPENDKHQTITVWLGEKDADKNSEEMSEASEDSDKELERRKKNIERISKKVMRDYSRKLLIEYEKQTTAGRLENDNVDNDLEEISSSNENSNMEVDESENTEKNTKKASSKLLKKGKEHVIIDMPEEEDVDLQLLSVRSSIEEDNHNKNREEQDSDSEYEDAVDDI